MAKTFDELQKEAEVYLVDLDSRYTKTFRKIVETAKDGTEESLEALRIFVSGLERDFNKLDNAAEGLYQSLKSSLGEMNSTNKVVNETVGVYKKIVSTVRDLKDNEKGITELTKGQLLRKREILRSNIEELRTLADQPEILERIGQATGLNQQQRTEIVELLLAENRYRKEGITLLDQTIGNADKQIELQRKYNSTLGLTGAVLDNVNKIGFRAFGGIGINLGVLGEGLEVAKLAAESTARTMSKELKEGESAGFGQQLEVLKAALPGIRKGLLEALADPLITATALATTLYTSFLSYNEASIQFSRLTGQSADGMMLLNDRLVTGTELLKFLVETSNQLGRNTAFAFSAGTIQGAAELAKLTGISSEEAGGLAKLTQVTGTSLDSNVEKVAKIVGNFNSTNRTAINVKQVLKDVGTVSDGISAAFGGSVVKLTQAASQAKKLGLELNQLDAIANSLLDFESSIESELEAQLLTGKNINLTKARELALSNDLEGVGKELFNNSANLLEFSRMNRIQQESYARALGLSRDQLARIAYLRALDKGMSEEQAALAAKVSVEEMKRLSIQEQLVTLVTKLSEALAPALDLFTKFLNTGFGVNLTLGSIVALIGIKFVAALIAAKKQLKEMTVYTSQINSDIASAATSSLVMANARGTVTGPLYGSTKVKTPDVIPTIGKIGGIGARLGALGILGKIGVIVGALAALGSLVSMISNITSKEDDAIIDSNGGVLVSGPKGSIQLNKDDTIVAGTNLGGGNSESLAVAKENNMLLKSMLSELKKKQNIYLGHAYRLNEGLEVYS